MRLTQSPMQERPINPHSQFRDHSPERRTLPIVLEELSVLNVSGPEDWQVRLVCSRGFLQAAENRFGRRPSVCLNVYNVDFAKIDMLSAGSLRSYGKVVVPAEENAPRLSSKELADEAAGAILSLYRSLLLFDKVFAVPGSYDKWVHDHQGRTPSHADIVSFAKHVKIGVPYLILPFRGLEDNLERIRQDKLKAYRAQAVVPATTPSRTAGTRPVLHLPKSIGGSNNVQS